MATDKYLNDLTFSAVTFPGIFQALWPAKEDPVYEEGVLVRIYFLPHLIV